MRGITQQDVVLVDIPGCRYTAVAELLPPRFPYQQSNWENDDRSLEVPNVSGSIWIRAYERGKTAQVAYAFFEGDADLVRCDDVNVDEIHRRQGIATFLYRLASFLFEAPIVPSDRLLEDGVKFWRHRAKIVC